MPRGIDKRHSRCENSCGRLITSTLGAGLCFVLTTSVSTVGAATCQPYSGTAQDAASSPAGPYVGVQNITIGGTPYAAPAVTTVLAPLTPEGNSGVLRTTTGHEITLPVGHDHHDRRGPSDPNEHAECLQAREPPGHHRRRHRPARAPGDRELPHAHGLRHDRRHGTARADGQRLTATRHVRRRRRAPAPSCTAAIGGQASPGNKRSGSESFLP